jgi:hopanoid biosynthesis associated protein HpnK
MKARLIVNADDLGLTEGHNRAIVEAYGRGILTSASLLACGLAFDDAIERLRGMPGLGLGVHLTLLEGTPVLHAAETPDLADGQGRFGLSHARFFRRLALRRRQIDQVRREWRAQVEKVLATGLAVTHFDSHKHVHMHPQLLEVALALANEFGIRRMRLSRPTRPAAGAKPALLGLLAVWARRRAQQWGVRTPDALLGLESSGQMTEARMLAVLSRSWEGARELMMHPAHPNPELGRLLAQGCGWSAEYRFTDELAALCSPNVKRLLDARGVRRIHFGDL